MAVVYGLIGYPLSHSWSAAYFTEKFKREGIRGATYAPFPLKDLSELTGLVRQTPGLRGLNVTIPYKEKVLDYLDELSETARSIGAVNTITLSHRQEKILLKGDNTDAFGFEKSLEENGILSQGRDPAKNGVRAPAGPVKSGIQASDGAMVLGTGGASRAVRHVLESLGWDVLLVSRLPKEDLSVSYEALRSRHFQSCRLIVNTTPLGMYPEVGGCPPIPYEYLSADHILYDLVYNPEHTRFLEMGKKAGCRTIGGLRMLVLQAERSWEIWNP